MVLFYGPAPVWSVGTVALGFHVFPLKTLTPLSPGTAHLQF